MDYSPRQPQPSLPVKTPTVQHLLAWYPVSNTLEHVEPKTTPNAHVCDVPVCVDCILVPGIINQPLSSLLEGCTEFVKKGWADPNVLFLAICTGSLAPAQTGVLDGYHVASNKMVIDAGKLNKAVRWEMPVRLSLRLENDNHFLRIRCSEFVRRK